MIKVSIDHLASLGDKYILRAISENLKNYSNDPINHHVLLSIYSMFDRGMNSDEELKKAISLLKQVIGNELEVTEDFIK